MDFQLLRSREVKDSYNYHLVQPDVHHLLPKFPWNPSLCCFWAIILWVREVQLTPVSVTGGFGSFPNFLWAPWSNFWDILFPFVTVWGLTDINHLSTALFSLCLSVHQTLLPLQGQAWEWPWTDPNPSPFWAELGFLCKLSLISENSGCLQLPADPPSSKLALFGHLRLSESNQLCFCWASRLTTDFCIIL